MGRTRRTDRRRWPSGRIIAPWLTATCPSCGGAKSAPARICYQCALPLRKRGRKPKPRCACGAPKSAIALRCMACDKRLRHERQRHICEHCGATFYQKTERRPDRPRTNVFCNRGCRGRHQAAQALQRHREKSRSALPLPVVPRPLCLGCGQPCPPPRRRFCCAACCTRSCRRLTIYREQAGMPEMQLGDEWYLAHQALTLARRTFRQQITGGASKSW